MNERFAVLRTVTGMASPAFTTPAGTLSTTPSGLIGGSSCSFVTPTGDSTFSSYLCPALRRELEAAHALVQLRRLLAGQRFDGHADGLAVFEQLALEIGGLAQRAADLEIHAIGHPGHEIAAFRTKLDVEFFQHDRNGTNHRIGHGPIVELDRHRPQAALDVPRQPEANVDKPLVIRLEGERLGFFLSLRSVLFVIDNDA